MAESGEGKAGLAQLTNFGDAGNVFDMRLNSAQSQAIREAVRKRDRSAQIYLFGSRVDDSKCAGDIDLLVLSDVIGFRDELRIKREILDAIGWQKLDLIVEKKQGQPRPIVEIARLTGVKL